MAIETTALNNNLGPKQSPRPNVALTTGQQPHFLNHKPPDNDDHRAKTSSNNDKPGDINISTRTNSESRLFTNNQSFSGTEHTKEHLNSSSSSTPILRSPALAQQQYEIAAKDHVEAILSGSQQQPTNTDPPAPNRNNSTTAPSVPLVKAEKPQQKKDSADNNKINVEQNQLSNVWPITDGKNLSQNRPIQLNATSTTTTTAAAGASPHMRRRPINTTGEEEDEEEEEVDGNNTTTQTDDEARLQFKTDPTPIAGLSSATPKFTGYIQTTSTRSVTFLSKLMTKLGINSCPDTPPDLHGPLEVNLTKDTVAAVETQLRPYLLPGGWYRPIECNAKDRVAIIIPFRDREQHLPILLKNLHPMLMRQQVNYGIFVVEETKADPFNRASLMNVGFLEANKMDNWDCFIFHDVDLIPLDDRNLYRCPEQPRHMSVAIDIFDYKWVWVAVVFMTKANNKFGKWHPVIA